MAFRVKEIFYTLQGEGYHAGRPAVFCRFLGCNLWSGLEKDRKTAKCQFCDTDFLQASESGGEFETASELVSAILSHFPPFNHENYRRYVVFTGGEPALQISSKLIQELKLHDIELGIETNGTIDLPKGLDWVTVSPKSGTELAVTSGSELKLVWPQDNIKLSDFEALDFEHLYLQPKDDNDRSKATQLAVKTCLENPVWKLSLQTHKFIGIP